jgi:hypothetical protein
MLDIVTEWLQLAEAAETLELCRKTKNDHPTIGKGTS